MQQDLGVAARDPGFSSQVSKLVTQTDVRIPAGGSLHEQDSQDSTSKSDPSIMFPCGHVRARLRAPLGISSHFPLLLPSLPTGARVADGAPGRKLWREVKGTGKVSGPPRMVPLGKSEHRPACSPTGGAQAWRIGTECLSCKPGMLGRGRAGSWR